MLSKLSYCKVSRFACTQKLPHYVVQALSSSQCTYRSLREMKITMSCRQFWTDWL